MRVIFVCNENTCRSPMAEVIFKSYTEDIDVISVGLSTISGQKAASNAIKICELNNLDLKNHRSKSFYEINLKEDDLILTLTSDIRNSIKKDNADINVYTLKEYADEKEYLDIKDPIGGDLEIYEICFCEINEYIKKILDLHDFK